MAEFESILTKIIAGSKDISWEFDVKDLFALLQDRLKGKMVEQSILEDKNEYDDFEAVSLSETDGVNIAIEHGLTKKKIKELKEDKRYKKIDELVKIFIEIYMSETLQEIDNPLKKLEKVCQELGIKKEEVAFELKRIVCDFERENRECADKIRKEGDFPNPGEDEVADLLVSEATGSLGTKPDDRTEGGKVLEIDFDKRRK